MRSSWPKIMILSLLPAFAFLLLISSCNIFAGLKPQVMGSSASDFTDRGDSYFDRHDYQNSLSCYSNALVLQPTSSRARMGMARSRLWLFLPDLMINLSQYQISGLASLIPLLNDQAFQTLIHYQGQQNVFQEIVSVLDSPNGIINGSGDGIIKPDNLELNEILSLCYSSLFVLNALNSSSDTVFAAPGDLIILSNGRLIPGVDFTVYFTNMIAATNVSALTSASNTLNLLRNCFNSTEIFLGTARKISIMTAYLDALASTLIRPAAALQGIDSNLGFYSATYKNLYAEISDALTNTNNFSSYKPFFNDMNRIRSMPERIGTNLNNLINVLVGFPAYSGSVASFTPIPWGWYTAPGPNFGLKGIILTNIISNTIINSNTYSDWYTNIGTNTITNTVTNFYTNTLYINFDDATNIITSITNILSPGFKAYLDSLFGGP